MCRVSELSLEMWSRSSLLLLINASESTGDEIGSGNFCYGDSISLDSNSEIKRGQK